MDKTHIFITIGVAIYAAVRLYQKYGKKKDQPQSAKTGHNDLSSSKDDYEPYSGK